MIGSPEPAPVFEPTNFGSSNLHVKTAINMSLKFGIYLVEQRIISPEQFCGLVKIQQESMMSLASLAIRQNALSIRQVANVLDVTEAQPTKLFGDAAIDLGYMDRLEVNRLLHEQQKQSPPIRQLLVECGLLTERQSTVLFMHFEKHVARQASDQAAIAAARRDAAEQATGQPQASPQKPATSTPMEVRAPKFRSAMPTESASQTTGNV